MLFWTSSDEGHDPKKSWVHTAWPHTPESLGHVFAAQFGRFGRTCGLSNYIEYLSYWRNRATGSTAVSFECNFCLFRHYFYPPVSWVEITVLLGRLMVWSTVPLFKCWEHTNMIIIIIIIIRIALLSTSFGNNPPFFSRGIRAAKHWSGQPTFPPPLWAHCVCSSNSSCSRNPVLTQNAPTR